VLAGRDVGDQRIDRSSGGFAGDVMANPPLASHTRIVANIRSRITTETHQHCAGTPPPSQHPSLDALAAHHAKRKRQNTKA
jgi:hypothetical protein